MLLGAYQKPFAAVRHAHYGAIAAQRIRAQLGSDATSIASIGLSIYQEAIAYCHDPQPQTLLAAQFSITFGVPAARSRAFCAAWMDAARDVPVRTLWQALLRD